ncbi:MAG TPA: dipicolinate synthase subunit DpsA [Firmicutes bacterium]|nr:dipicolinate synthase subunit DpsA [Bacillota bacterium]
MGRGLEGLVISVLGGDYREVGLIKEFLAQGARVVIFGYPPMPELTGCQPARTVWDAIRGANVIVVAMGGLDVGGKIRTLDPDVTVHVTEELLMAIGPGVPVLIGVARPRLKNLANKHGINLIEVAEIDEIAIANSIPTAEGAVQIAMEELPITIHGSNSFVMGFGRVGITMARVLIGLGAHTYVVARNPAQLARAEEMGAVAISMADIKEYIGLADVVFNTIPYIVLTEDILKCMKAGSLIIDLASDPGGTDFDAAAKLGIRAILALGLPGKVAPRTAGQILVRTVPGLIQRTLALSRRP